MLFFKRHRPRYLLKSEHISSLELLSGQKMSFAAAVFTGWGFRMKKDMEMNASNNETSSLPGLVLHSAARYDFLVWLYFLGREQVFRETIFRLGHLNIGESVLDVGCGTGSLAIAAKRLVGSAGTVHGIDASPEMISRAEKKARKAGAGVVFKNAFAQALPFPDTRFDVVTATLMLHHLPKNARQECIHEIRRVLKPGGRVLVVDFERSTRGRSGFLARFHRHGSLNFHDLNSMLNETGLNIVENSNVGMGIHDLQFVLATSPCSIGS
jgi:ubiquinone/menaquinone biosynthesis C-methylase UbiE